jgi:tetratricopeptide (TPR) repeat protein
MEKAYPWIQEAGAAFPSVLDQENMVGQYYGFKAVPVGIYFDEQGRMAKGPSAIDIRQEEAWHALVQWIREGTFPPSWSPANRQSTFDESRTTAEAEADTYFHSALAFLKQGPREQALTALRKAIRLDPENWIMRKQLWALEYPEKFYQGAVDFRWQQEHLKRENKDIAST